MLLLQAKNKQLFSEIYILASLMCVLPKHIFFLEREFKMDKKNKYHNLPSAAGSKSSKWKTLLLVNGEGFVTHKLRTVFLLGKKERKSVYRNLTYNHVIWQSS